MGSFYIASLERDCVWKSWNQPGLLERSIVVKKLDVALQIASPNFNRASLEVQFDLLENGLRGITRADDFDANFWCLWVWRDVAKLRKERFGQPCDICHFYAVSGFNAAFGDASSCRGVIAQQISDADLVQAVKVRGWAHFDVAPSIQFDFVRQILKARIVDHVLPGQWSCVGQGSHKLTPG
jgi:hypothetical protein